MHLLIYISKRYIVLPEFSDNLRATLGITGSEVSEKDREVSVVEMGGRQGGALFVIVTEEPSDLN